MTLTENETSGSESSNLFDFVLYYRQLLDYTVYVVTSVYSNSVSDSASVSSCCYCCWECCPSSGSAMHKVRYSGQYPSTSLC